MNIYLAGPMSGIPHFNFPKFMKAAKYLRTVYGGGSGMAQDNLVFNPAERDIETYGDNKEIFNATGDIEKATGGGFSLSEAMKADLVWICDEAEAIALLPGWEHSSGARTEWSLANCLRLKVIYLEETDYA